ncbi:MAG: hypothetical protein JKY19_06185 [Alcanivoracaceae bacterium]|nr:hypothetical protein [Alcanivoracaceae bacterium]
MKTKLLIAALTLTIGTLAIACPGGKHRVASTLNLTDEQRQKFEVVMTEKGESMQAAMAVVHGDTRVKLAEFLSEEQLQTLDERKNRHAGMRRHRDTSK